ncbi:MAG: nuclear transport factor 2 family protein [Proteobacteria bacterium]|nr:nuclear transport factor 2 family protein [Pseudomonadota bacterium]
MSFPEEEFRAMQRDLGILKDIEAIKRVKHAYFRCINTANIEELKPLLHKDVVMHFFCGTYEWALYGRDEYVATIFADFNQNVTAQHTAHHPEIEIVSETEANGTWYLHDHFYHFADRHHVTGAALYRDHYVKEDGLWQIIESRYERIYEIDLVMAERPSVASHFLARTGSKSPGPA